MFKRFVREIVLTADLMRKTSMTIPHDAISVEELFARYLEGSEEIFSRVQERQAEYDGEFDEVINMKIRGDLDAISAFELSEELKEKRLTHEQSKEHIQDNNKELDDITGNSGDIGQESSGQEVNS